jgi:hypothetical protein
MLEFYNQFRDEIKTGDLIEWCANSILGATIRSITKQNVNHTSVAIWDQTIINRPIAELYGEKRLYVGEAVASGFKKTFLSQELSNYDGEVYWAQLNPEYNDKRLLIAREAHRLKGRPYDYVSLIRNLWRRVPLNAKKLYCSEALQLALIGAGLLDNDFSPTGKQKHAGCGLRPGEFGLTNLYLSPVRIF